MFAELGTVPQITILVHTDLGTSTRFTNPLANYENPKCVHCLGHYYYYYYYFYYTETNDACPLAA